MAAYAPSHHGVRSPGAACTKPFGGADTSGGFVDRVVAVGGDRLSFRLGRFIRIAGTCGG
jgi:hypothetical protein